MFLYSLYASLFGTYKRPSSTDTPPPSTVQPITEFRESATFMMDDRDEAESFGHGADIGSSFFEDDGFDINPATGYPMMGCVDMMGNAYGFDSSDDDLFYSATSDDDFTIDTDSISDDSWSSNFDSFSDW